VNTSNKMTNGAIRRQAAIALLTLLLAAVPSQSAHAEGGGMESNSAPALVSKTSASAVVADASSASPPLRFTHLTTDQGLSQNHIQAILQDRQGFMWFSTRDGLNRYDGNSFVVFKHNHYDPGTLSGNFIQDLLEDDQGCLWIATFDGGINKFDPATERFTHYRHDPNNPNSIGSDAVVCIARDSRGYLWFGTGNGSLNKFDPATETFTCFRKDSNGQSVGGIDAIIEDSHGDIWFVGDRGLFHLNPQTGQIVRPPGTVGLAADYLCKDKAGNLWMLAWTPVVGLIKYDPQAERLTKYPLGAGAVGLPRSRLLDDGQNGFWVASSLGLYHFDRQTECFTHRFQHDETNPDSLNNNRVVSIYQDRAGLLWLGTEQGGLNILNFQQKQFGCYRHEPTKPNSLSPGRVCAIHQDSNGIVWVGFAPRALDRLDRKTGQFTHYVPGPDNKNTLGQGSDLNGIYKDTQGYVWLGGWNSGLDRFDERSGQFKHYRHNPDDPNSLISNDVLCVYEDRSGHLWVGQSVGLSRFDRATEQFANYRPNPDVPTSLRNGYVRTIYQDRSGVLWLGTSGGVLSRFDDKTKTFVNYTSDSRNPHRLNGGVINAIHEDQAGTLWLGAADGLYRFDRKNETFTRYTESQGLPSSAIAGILEDNSGRLWLSTQNGLSRFDPRTETFRNYDASDGLQDNDFSQGCYAQGQNGEMFFGDSKGFNTFFPENIRDNPYVPPVVLTDFQLFNKPVEIGKESPLKKAINVADQIALRYDQNVFRLRFAALSFAQPQKNRYACKLEGFDDDWRYTDAGGRSATYTRLVPGNYTFRVKASNNDGVWNEQGTSIKIIVIPAWWQTWWFRGAAAAALLMLAYEGFRLRMRNINVRNVKLEKLVAERTTELQQKSDELRNSAIALRNLVEDLNEKTVALETTNTKLEAVNKELESFAYSVSHDLRTPLRGIDGFSQALLDDYAGKLDDEGKHYLERIRSGSQRMAQLIDDMLNLSRVTRGEMRLEKVNLSELAQDIVGELARREPERKVNFAIASEVVAAGDARLLRVALDNLLGNAWKFTSKRPEASIEFGRTQQGGHTVYFVRDNGAGFDMQYAARLFGAFQRLHTTEEFPGTGIGLATVQRIIHRHGGRIWAESKVGEGATFYFMLQ
jgi:ligand-binding sensor domain-containing protein/signal transduction histidine kinase